MAQQAAAKLAAYNKATAVTFWHEPDGDMTPAQYIAASQRLLPIFKRTKVRVGPILNWWLLNKHPDIFATLCPEELFAIWDWFGIDTYETGTIARPGPVKPAERIQLLVDFLKARGHGTIPIGIGEYNGYSAASIAAVGEALLSTPNVWFGCVWNVTGGTNHVLSGDRLTAFKKTLSDPRRARTV
ncbi:MAG: hypothetical protein ACR2K3_10235 [Nocardioides sp.]